MRSAPSKIPSRSSRAANPRPLPDRRYSKRRLYAEIWEMVERVPPGKVATYGQIAELCGIPGQARLVGYALYSLPPGSGVPWQRVINAKGMISLGDLDGKFDEQKTLLRKEGIRFIRDVIDLAKYRWQPRRHG
jgi:methylated-DNA-protein-cysteine methyltransferase-like protein